MSPEGRVGWRYLLGSVVHHRRSSAARLLRRIFDQPVSTVGLAALVLGGARLTETLPPREVQLVAPPGLSASDAQAYVQRDVTAVPGQFVLEVAGATVLGREGWVLSSDRLVEGIWQEAGHPAVDLVPRGWVEEARRLPGVSVSLLMPWLPNYYHWTVQAVPRVLAVREVLGPRVHDVDHWLVPGGAPAYVGEWLDRLGVPAERRVEVWGRRQRLELEHLVVASIPGRNRWVPPSTVEGLRGAVAGLLPDRPEPSLGRRVLIHRADGDRRVLLNAGAVFAALEPRGFEVVDTARLTLADEVRLFGEAAVVVGVHGAGLTNVVYCRPGTHLVEIAPKGLVFPTFAKLAEAAGVVHHLVPGLEPALPGPFRFPDVLADVVADVEGLVDVLDALPTPTPSGSLPYRPA